jgi:hypothetical protein
MIKFKFANKVQVIRKIISRISDLRDLIVIDLDAVSDASANDAASQLSKSRSNLDNMIVSEPSLYCRFGADQNAALLFDKLKIELPKNEAINSVLLPYFSTQLQQEKLKEEFM